jgi:signal transduction histidine kinase
MFKNLHTGTKLAILCSLFIVSLGVATYQLITEKQIAIDFAGKELIGNRYLSALREIYAEVLIRSSTDGLTEQPNNSEILALNTLSSAETASGGVLRTAELEIALVAMLSELWSNKPERDPNELKSGALAQAKTLAKRIGDNSNLALDPDLDTYYLQDVVTSKLPIFLGQLGELQTLLRRMDAADAPSAERGVRVLILDELLRSTMEDMQKGIATAYYGNLDGSLNRAVGTAFTEMMSASTSFLDSLQSNTVNGEVDGLGIASIGRTYEGTVSRAVRAWGLTQSELDRLLKQRIANLTGKLNGSLALIGALAMLCILFATMTYAHIARPLEMFERIILKVRETENYNLRIDHSSDDEIGRLAIAFNDMLSELVAMRARESADHLELARAARLTTMGAMTASIAHEIRQPLAAIAMNGGAGLRWLTRTTPEIEEARAALKKVIDDAHSAGQVIDSIRSIFKKDSHNRAFINVNDLINNVLVLVHGRLDRHHISAKADLQAELPPVLADRVQLQQVILNLIMNGVDSMVSVRNRTRLLTIKSELKHPRDVLITVQDAGTGIDPNNIGRIFEMFFTTKANGMGMGLFICRSIIEAHGGRLWASAAIPHGSNFHILLPGDDIKG